MTEATLFEGGRVFTGTAYVEALLVEDGRVLVAGPLEEARRQAATGTERLQLNGALVIPGLADAHLHVAELTRLRRGIDLSGVRGTEELSRALQSVGGAPSASPILGRGYDLGNLSRADWPTAASLDRAVAERPVLLYDRSSHVAFANSRTLEELERGGPLSPSVAARVGRLPDGRPSGQLFEEAMRYAAGVLADRAPVPPEQLDETLRSLGGQGLVALGALSAGPTEITGLRELVAKGAVRPRVRAYPPLARWKELDRAELDPGDERFRVVGVKAFLDGAFGPRTASLTAPYADEPSTSGLDVGDSAVLHDELTAAAEAGLAPALHAIGDRAVVRATELISEIPRVPGRPARIEHASLTPPETFGALRKSAATLVVQPGFVLSDLWLGDRLGSPRRRWAYAFRSLIDNGLTLAGSSDAPYDPADPWRGIRALVRRRDDAGGSANLAPRERLSVEESLSLYTRGARLALGDTDAGRLDPGSPADLAVLRVPRLSEVLAVDRPVAQTWIGGRPAGGGPSGLSGDREQTV